jgi:Ethanolamine utilization protein EutJ (predicted chaperonin)
MAQDDISSKLASAKTALAHANSSFPSANAPKPAPKPVAVAPKAAAPSIGSDVAAGLKWNTDQAKAVMAPKLHKGGPVKKDGIYDLKKGEHVLTADEATKARKHALMASGMKSLSMTPAKKNLAGRLSTTKDQGQSVTVAKGN